MVVNTSKHFHFCISSVTCLGFETESLSTIATWSLQIHSLLSCQAYGTICQLPSALTPCHLMASPEPAAGQDVDEHDQPSVQRY